MGGTSGASVGNSLKLVVEKDERSVDEPSWGRILYDNGGKHWGIGRIRCLSYRLTPLMTDRKKSRERLAMLVSS